MLRIAEFLKSRGIRILLSIQFLLILIGVLGLFSPRGIIVGTQETERILTEGVPLKPGVYTARLYYEVDQDETGSFGVSAQGLSFRGLRYNEVPLYKGAGMRECQFYLTQQVDGLRVDVKESEEAKVRVLGAEIETGTEGSRIYLFWVILSCAGLDGILFLVMSHKNNPIPLERQVVFLGIPALTLLSSLPVMVDYTMIGADLIYHMLRIETLAESICRGELGARIGSAWLAGHGYASSIFYGDTLLAVPALLRILGFSPDSAYRLFVVMVNLATAWVAYACFSRCFRSRYIGMFGSVLYVFQPYRIYNIYNHAAVGEYTAMIFLPLLAWGFYKVYTEDSKRKGYFWNCVILTIGFSGLIQSHMLSCEMVGFFVTLLCLILWRKTFRMRIFQVLMLTVVLTIAVNAWFLVPFLDLMTADSYYLERNANMMIQDRGVLPAHLLYTLQAGGSSSRFAETGMMDTEPIGIGMALLLCILLWVILQFRYKNKKLSAERHRERKAGNTALILGVVALFMSTCYFPWDYLSSRNRIFAVLNGSIQFPTRLTEVAGICIVIMGCIAAVWVLDEIKSRDKEGVIVGGIAAAAILFGSYQLNDILLTRDSFLRIYSAQGMGAYSAVLGAEYLPEGAVMEHMTYHEPVVSEGVSMTDYGKNGLKAEGYVEAEKEGYIEFPMLYYKGYEAYSVDTGEALVVSKGDNSDVRVLFPEGFSGEIQVKYAGMWYWCVAEAVSIISGLGIWILHVISTKAFWIHENKKAYNSKTSLFRRLKK